MIGSLNLHFKLHREVASEQEVLRTDAQLCYHGLAYHHPNTNSTCTGELVKNSLHSSSPKHKDLVAAFVVCLHKDVFSVHKNTNV